MRQRIATSFAGHFFLFLIIIAAITPGLAAQEFPIKAVGKGYLVVRAKICRDGVEMDRHLLVDLMCPLPLVYYPEEALFLGIRSARGAKVDIELGEATLKQVPVRLARVRLMEQITKRCASELEEVPVVGIMGWQAFANFQFQLNPRKMTIQLSPPAVAGDLSAPEEGSGILQVPLLMEKGLPRLQAKLEGKVEGLLYLATGHPHAFLMSGAMSRAGVLDKKVNLLEVDKVKLGGVVPFRPLEIDKLLYRVPGPVLGGLGWNFWRNYQLSIDGVNLIATLVRVRHDPFPEAEQNFILSANKGVPGLEKFLLDFPQGPFAAKAAYRIFEILEKEGSVDGARLRQAGTRWAGLLPVVEQGDAYLQVARALMDLLPVPAETIKVIDQGIVASRQAVEKEVAYRLQHQAGRFWLEQKDYKQARRHLINAVYGLLHEGPANLDYGRAWKGLGKASRALGAFLRAILDEVKAGPEALFALEKLRDDTAPTGRTGMVAMIRQRLEGRIPAYRNPKKPEPVKALPLHRPLVEFYTGVDSKSDLGVGLALGALSDFYGDEVSILSHHVHSPMPDPLFCGSGGQRASRFGVERAPRLFVDGGLTIEKGGRAGKAPELFKQINAAIKSTRQQPSPWRLTGEAKLDKAKGIITGMVKVAGPDCRLQVWLAEKNAIYAGRNRLFVHHYVSRSRLTLKPGSRPDKAGQVSFRADLKRIWDGLRWTLEGIEEQLIDQDFTFRWKPTKADLAELVLVVMVTRPNSFIPVESMVIIPAGPAQEARERAKAAAAKAAKENPTAPGKAPGKKLKISSPLRIKIRRTK